MPKKENQREEFAGGKKLLMGCIESAAKYGRIKLTALSLVLRRSWDAFSSLNLTKAQSPLGCIH
jgi:hypothetical protein